jgi:hypothetical protein
LTKEREPPGERSKDAAEQCVVERRDAVVRCLRTTDSAQPLP